MLPDYIGTKQRLQSTITRWFRKRVRQHMGPLGDIPRYSVFEGSGTSIIRPDNREDITDMRRLENEFSIKYDEVPQLTLIDIFNKLDPVAQEMASAMANQLYGTVTEATHRTGNVVQGKGKITPDAILEVLDKIEIVFNENGQPQMPQIHYHPDATETLSEALIRLENEVEYREKLEEIISEKRRLWRVREASRKLVG